MTDTTESKFHTTESSRTASKDFSISNFAIGMGIFCFFGLIYWLGGNGSGVERIFIRFQIPYDVWILFYSHLTVTFLSLLLIYNSNFLEAMAVVLSSKNATANFFKEAKGSGNFFKKNSQTIAVCILGLVTFAAIGYALLEMISGENVPKIEILVGIIGLGSAFLVYKMEYRPYVKPKPMANILVSNKHLIWETYETAGKMKLEGDQFAYQERGANFIRIMPNEDVDIPPMSKVFFIQPGGTKYKYTNQALGIGSVRGNVFFDIEIKLDQTYMPESLKIADITFLKRLFQSEANALEFIEDHIDDKQLEAAQSSGGKRISLAHNYVLSNKSAVDEDANDILEKVSDLSGYRFAVNAMKNSLRSELNKQLTINTENLIKFNLNITHDGMNEHELVAKINATKQEAQRFREDIVKKFVDAITARIAQRGGNLDSGLSNRVTTLITQLTGNPTYNNYLETKEQVRIQNDAAKKTGKKNLGHLEILGDD